MSFGVERKKLLSHGVNLGTTNKPKIFVKPDILTEKQNKNSIIELSNTQKQTHKTKNFIVLYNGFPLKNKEFNLIVNHSPQMHKPLRLPVFKTDNHGIMCVLIEPVFQNNGDFNPQASLYQPLKFSERLGFVIKDKNNFNKKNILYAKNYIAKYIDLGISVHFLRTMIQKSDQGNHTLDASNNSVIENWLNAVYQSDDIKHEYKKFNTHTERTAKSLKYTRHTNNALMSIGALGVIAAGIVATAGLIAPVAVAVGGGILAAGSSGSMVAKQMETQTPDISRLRDTKTTAEKTVVQI